MQSQAVQAPDLRRLLAAAVLLCCVSSSVFGADWRRITSDHFEILSSVRPAETRLVLEHLEAANEFFATILGPAPQKSEPVRVVIFSSRREYERYRPIESSVAHYARIAGRDYIALTITGDGVLPSALHELFHAAVGRRNWRLPAWLSEGLAEVHSTFRITAGHVSNGSVIVERQSALLKDLPVSLQHVISVEIGSDDYTRKSLRNNFYNQAWALAHMLSLHPRYAPELPDLIKRLRQGEVSETTLETVYNFPLKAIEDDLRTYIANGHYREQRFNLPETLRHTAPEPERADEFDVKLALVDLASRSGSIDDARRDLAALIAANPERPEPYVSLGYLANRDGRGDPDGSFSRAIELGSRNPTMLQDYATFAAQSNPRNAARALELLLELRPNDRSARLAYAEIQANLRQYRPALETLRLYGEPEERDRLRYLRVAAVVKAELDDRGGAREDARLWYQMAANMQDRDRASRILAYLENRDQVDKARRNAPQQTPGGKQEDAFGAGKAASAPPSVSGQLAAFECKTEPERLMIQTPDGPAIFIVEDFNQLSVYGLAAQTVEISCGPQQPTPVHVEYERLGEEMKGIVGIARAIYFEPKPRSVQ